MILFFDTETTGLAKFDKPANDPSQPRLVQLGLILCDDELNVVSEACILCDPLATIEQGAFNAHGKSNEYCDKHGIEVKYALDIFWSFVSKASIVVAHNLKFDKLILDVAFLEHKSDFPPRVGFCTMLESSPILKLPNHSGRGGYKWPKLSEAYEYFFPGQKIEGAHNALADCKATLAIYKKLMELKQTSICNNIDLPQGMVHTV